MSPIKRLRTSSSSTSSFSSSSSSSSSTYIMSPANSPVTKPMTSEEEASSRKPKALPHIPIEVLRQISAHLDLPSAAALSRTCKSLRDAGEVKVWEELDLTCGRDHYCDTWDWTDDEHKSILGELLVRVTARRAALDSYPPRADYIRAIRLEPEGGERGVLAKRLLDILGLVSSSLRHLYVLPCIYTSKPSPSGHPITFDSHFLNGLDDISLFPMIESLAVFDFEGPSLTFSLIRKCPNLRALDICMGSSLPSDEPLHAPFPRMPKVERVVIQHMENTALFDYDELRVDLTQLFEVAPMLKELKVGGWNYDWRISSVLKKHFRGLKSLAMLAQDHGAVGRLGISRAAKEKLGPDPLPTVLEEVVMGDNTIEENELRLRDTDVPKVTSLKRLSILTAPRMDNSEYADLGIGPSPKKVYHMGKTTATHISQTPNLTSIQLVYIDEHYPQTYDTPCADNSRYFVPSTEWEKKGHRGSVIRSYGTAIPFVHLRILTRAMEHPDGNMYVGARRSWKHFVTYKKRTVPWETLVAVYQAAGISMDWTEGGRAMRLGESEEKASRAWAILDGWRDEAHDSSEAEYETDSDDIDGSSDSDDEGTDDEDHHHHHHHHHPHHFDIPGGFDATDFDDFDDEDGEEGWETDDDSDPIGGWNF